tara:strand:- start:2103 stop:2651 length:549 start_codon:yes stop_codon:yes gene_type:complete
MENLDIENIIQNAEIQKQKKKKRINSGDKGKRTERQLGKKLQERFGFEFTRTLGSGNRWGQVTFLPQHAQQTFTGDLVCPSNFRWVIESKGGYDDIDPLTMLTQGHHKVDEWIEQAIKESDHSERNPIICWKKNRKPWVGMVETKYLKGRRFKYSFKYKKWTLIPLDVVLEFEDEFFFTEGD